MSRTFRNREPYDISWLNQNKPFTLLNRIITKQYTDKRHGQCNAPKWFRDIKNRNFRIRNSQIIRNYLKQDINEIDLVLIPFKKNANYEWW